MGFFMKKFLFCFLIFNLFLVNSSFANTSTVYSPDIEIGQFFTYEVITSSLDVTHKREQFVKENVFHYYMQQFSIDNHVEISVVNVTNEIVNFTFSCHL